MITLQLKIGKNALIQLLRDQIKEALPGVELCEAEVKIDVSGYDYDGAELEEIEFVAEVSDDTPFKQVKELNNKGWRIHY